MALDRMPPILRRVAEIVKQVGATREQTERQRGEGDSTRDSGPGERAGGGRSAEHEQVLGPLPDTDGLQPGAKATAGRTHDPDRAAHRACARPAPLRAPGLRVGRGYPRGCIDSGHLGRPLGTTRFCGPRPSPARHRETFLKRLSRSRTTPDGRESDPRVRPSRTRPAMSASATARLSIRPLPPRLSPLRRARRTLALAVALCLVPIAFSYGGCWPDRRTRASRSAPSSGSATTARPRSPPRSRASTTRGTRPRPAARRCTSSPSTRRWHPVHPPNIAPLIHPALAGRGSVDAHRDVDRCQRPGPGHPVPQRPQLPADGGRRGLDRHPPHLGRRSTRAARAVGVAAARADGGAAGVALAAAGHLQQRLQAAGLGRRVRRRRAHLAPLQTGTGDDRRATPTAAIDIQSGRRPQRSRPTSTSRARTCR